MDTGTILQRHGPTAPIFTRKRWREFLAAERAVKDAERKAEGLRQARERDAALAAIQDARDAVRAAFEHDAQSHAEQARLLELTHALDAFNSAKSAADRVRLAQAIIAPAMAAKHLFEMRDEDEAIALLMLNG